MNILKAKNKKYLTILCLTIIIAVIASLICSFTFNNIAPNMANGGLINATEPTTELSNGDC